MKGPDNGAAPDQFLSELRDELERSGDERTRATNQRFFREPVNCFGVKTPVVRAMAARYFRALGHPEKELVFHLCEELFRSDSCEEAFIASDWAYRIRHEYVPEDMQTFGRWIERYVNNWAKCDTLCNHAVGALVEQYPTLVDTLLEWAGSGNRWLRRAAAVTLILPARKGLFLSEVFGIADRLLPDEEDLVQKGYGWMLKEASRKHQEEVFGYVMRHRGDMPRTALRYAIEKMPRELKDRAMDRR
ncbi:MAG TPA: DNA alkylation repair protein [Methanomicrobiales archaeon]|nr:DNA alkylation repair protein [Methanomicrobiales archaeon]